MTKSRVPNIELVYDRQCPNVERARAMIRAVLRAVGAEPLWTEWDREAADTPVDRRCFASPTVLVNGCDVACEETGEVRVDANACRVYIDASGRASGVPSVHLIAKAVNRPSVNQSRVDSL